MHAVIDYRPALRCRTGVGEYVHQLSRALRLSFPDDALTLFTSSLKDRPLPDVQRDIPGARVSDHRVPVQIVNLAWHRLEWPPVEWCVGHRCDVAFSPHPLLLPARNAAQVVMIHDLDFLAHPERTHREIRRDYPALARAHAHRADRIITPSQHTKNEVRHLFDVPAERITVCPPGVPAWQARVSGPDPNGYMLFVGTLEPRKNVSGLLAAYAHLLDAHPNLPPLVLAGRPGSDAAEILAAIARPPLAGRVRHLGYVDEGDRQALYAGARMLMLPSFEEGFGMPVLEAMSLGIPVIASARGGLSELVGDAGLLVDPRDGRSISEAMTAVLTDTVLARQMSSRGIARAAGYTWHRTGALVHQVFAEVAAARRVLSKSDTRLRTTRRTAPGTATTRSAAPRELEPSGLNPRP
jgi:glycosyltransferase involved in cell wall biosynthesis